MAPDNVTRLMPGALATLHVDSPAAGWIVRREVPIGTREHPGWIDILAFNPKTRVLLIIEVKTDLVDIGGLERQLDWYQRRRPASGLPLRWRDLMSVIRGAQPDSADWSLAMIDPRSRVREWCRPTVLDGRRSAAPYRHIADFLRPR